jgi:phosphoglycolate phosphatase
MSFGITEALLKNHETSAWQQQLLDELVPELKVIYSDIDGTLLGPGGCLFKDSQHGLTGVPALAIIQCHIENIDIVPVSGRTSRQLHSISRVLGFESWISELGCQITYNNGESAVKNIGNYPETDFSVWESILNDGSPALLFENFTGRLEYHSPWDQDRDFTHLLRGSIDLTAANNLLFANGFTNLKIVDNGRVRRRSIALHPDIEEVRAYHLLPLDSSKATAVSKDISLRGIDKSSTIAIGDSESDLQLAESVGALFLVKNSLTDSPQLLKQLDTYGNVFVTQDEMGLGWAEVVRYLLRRKQL